VPFRDSLPDDVSIEGDIRACVTADLLPDGSFGEEWLVVTEDAVLVYRQPGGGSTERRLRLALAEIKSIRAEALVGGGALEARLDGRTVELVRYTNSRAQHFAALAKVANRWIKGEEGSLEKPEEKRCPRCGLPLLAGTRVCAACMPRRKTLIRLITYLRPYWKQAVGLSLLSIITTALGLVPPILTKPFLDDVLVGKGRSLVERCLLLAVLTAVLFGSRILMSTIGALQGWLSAWLGNKVTHDIRCGLYGHLQFLSMHYYDKRKTGTVISRVNQDTRMLQQFLVWGSQDLIMNVLLVVGIGVALFVTSPLLAALVFLPAPVVAVLSLGIWRKVRHLMHRMFNRWGRLNALLSESLGGFRVVKAFAQEDREISRFSASSGELAEAGIRLERTWGILFSVLSMIIMTGSLLVYYVGGRKVISGPMTPGDLMKIISLVAMFYGPVRVMSLLINWSSRALAAAERVFEVLDTEPEVENQEAAVPMPHIRGKVEFRGVTFGYEPHKPVLKGMEFEVAENEMIGLVGKSGAGKTTTINLICRFYEADEGEVLIDGVPITDIRLSDIRRQMGIVPQDTFLFSGTIIENISYARADATREEVIRAAKVANAHDFILRKPDGYETMVGEGGKGLSAGERQRIAIARAVLHNPRILILDEATSQLDVETEKQIQDAIARLVEGRTTIAIAHRLSTLRNADRLIVLKNGEIVEIGTHEELMDKEGGEFQRLVKIYREVSSVRAVER